VLDVIKIVRISVKYAFLNLRKKWLIYCNSIWENVQITNLYFNHINWEAKKRKIKEIVLRLSIINLIEEILEKWYLVETRSKDDELYIYHKIKYEIEWENFCLILSEVKKTWKIILLSGFLQY